MDHGQTGFWIDGGEAARNATPVRKRYVEPLSTGNDMGHGEHVPLAGEHHAASSPFAAQDAHRGTGCENLDIHDSRKDARDRIDDRLVWIASVRKPRASSSDLQRNNGRREAPERSPPSAYLAWSERENPSASPATGSGWPDH